MRMSIFASLIQHGTEVLVIMIREEKEIEGIQIGKEEVKLSLGVDNMMVYIENPKDFTKTIVDLINEFGKVAGHKINIQKSMAFLHTNNELSEKEPKKTIPFTIAKNKIRYQEINLTKEVKDLYLENYKILKKTWGRFK